MGGNEYSGCIIDGSRIVGVKHGESTGDSVIQTEDGRLWVPSSNDVTGGTGTIVRPIIRTIDRS